MLTIQDKKALINRLQKDILQWEGYRPPSTEMQKVMGLGPIEEAFPNGVFPLGAIHEWVCRNNEQVAASSGLITGLLSVLMKNGGACLWIGSTNPIFPTALPAFGIAAERLIFIRVTKDWEALWVMEEALKCSGLAAVIAEMRDIDFKQSRRLQLAVEQSEVTGFILRNASKKMNNTVCAARWQVSSLPSIAPDGLPGLGFPRWRVELLKVRNGRPGSWTLAWSEGKFNIAEDRKMVRRQRQQVG